MIAEQGRLFAVNPFEGIHRKRNYQNRHNIHKEF